LLKVLKTEIRSEQNMKKNIVTYEWMSWRQISKLQLLSNNKKELQRRRRKEKEERRRRKSDTRKRRS
jgi:hypothetical protein